MCQKVHFLCAELQIFGVGILISKKISKSVKEKVTDRFTNSLTFDLQAVTFLSYGLSSAKLEQRLTPILAQNFQTSA